MKVLVTGAYGFIARNLIAAIGASYGDELTVYRCGSDCRRDTLKAYCTDCDFVFHLAGANRPENESDFMKINAGLTGELASCLREHGNKCPVMYASSVYAQAAGNAYGESKRAGEEIMQAHAAQTGADVMIYRLSHVFGKWCKPYYNSVVATFCHRTAHGLSIDIHDPHKIMELLYIDDLTDELLRAMRGQANRDGAFCRVPISYKTTLGHIAGTIKSFNGIKASLGVPDMSNRLTCALYGTWLTYLPQYRLTTELDEKRDARGCFAEILKTPERGQIGVNIIRPREVKGGHWHKSKSEKFVTVHGRVLIRMRRVDSCDTEESFTLEVGGDKLCVADIAPGYAHSIENLSDTDDAVVIIWASECYDERRSDTYPAEVSRGEA